MIDRLEHPRRADGRCRSGRFGAGNSRFGGASRFGGIAGFAASVGPASLSRRRTCSRRRRAGSRTRRSFAAAHSGPRRSSGRSDRNATFIFADNCRVSCRFIPADGSGSGSRSGRRCIRRRLAETDRNRSRFRRCARKVIRRRRRACGFNQRRLIRPVDDVAKFDTSLTATRVPRTG